MSKFGKAIGEHIDCTLLTGGGAGAPLGLLNHDGVAHADAGSDGVRT